MTKWRRQSVSEQIPFRTMSLTFDAARQGRRSSLPKAPDTAFGRRFASPGTAPDRLTASEARAARRRTARRDEQAVSAWLRELAGRPR
jgi:hypothetical protein